jgi:hypothetical protein
MKNATHILSFFLFGLIGMNAQQEKGIVGSGNWLNIWTEFRPSKVDYREADQILSGNINTNTTLYKKNTYVLEGNVYVTNSATLTIEPGTVIIGSFESKGSLIITKGATINANGSETDPIIFTSNRSSRKAGDWGGIVILGDAPINKFGNSGAINYDLDATLTTYGGDNIVGSSGIFRYVRIEYAGKKVKGENFNSLLLAGVGSQTQIDHVMVSFSGGDSFEIAGGTLQISKLVSYRCSNIDYRFTQGTQCKIDNSLAVRSSYLTSSNSRCMEIVSSDKKDDADLTRKQTLVTGTNLTFVNDSDNVDADMQSGLIKEAIFIGDNVATVLRKNVISGFKPAIVLNSNIKLDNENLKKIQLEEMYFNNCEGNVFTEKLTENEDLEGWYGNSTFFNVYAKSTNKETFIDFLNERSPDFRLKLTRITASK